MPSIGNWTEERLALLTEMREQKPKAIWEALNKLPGPHLTKNAVIGKHNRMFGFKKPVKTEAEKRAARAASRARDAAKKRVKRAKENRSKLGLGAQIQSINRGPKVKAEKFKARAADVVSLRKPIIELQTMECRWADEHRNDVGLHTFCGNPTLDGHSYCEAHREIARGDGTASERAAMRNARSIARAA